MKGVFSSLDKSGKDVSFRVKLRPFLFERKGISGQSSAEFLIILAVILIVLIFIIGFDASTMVRHIEKEEVDRTVIVLDSMESLGELVYAQGAGSQNKALISFPDSIENISLINNTIYITNNDNQLFHRNLDFNVSAEDLSNPNGRKYLYARSVYSNVTYSFAPINYSY